MKWSPELIRAIERLTESIWGLCDAIDDAKMNEGAAREEVASAIERARSEPSAQETSGPNG